METIANRIRGLRHKNEWTIPMLAEKVKCSDKTIMRYEKGETQPDAHTLARLAFSFEVSTDYLIGLSDNMKSFKMQEKFNKLGDVFLNSPDKDCTYFWITYNSDILADTFNVSGQTEWVDFVESDPSRELHRLRSVIPEKAIKLCTKVYGTPMVVNTENDLEVYMVFGGHAIIKKELLDTHFPHMLEPFEV